MVFNEMIHHLSTEVLLMEQEQEEHIRLQLEGKRDSRASSLMRAERLEDEYHIECFQNAEDEEYDPSLTSGAFENFCNHREENINDSNDMDVALEAPHYAVRSPECSMPPGQQRAPIESWIAGASVSCRSPMDHRPSIAEATSQRDDSRGRSSLRASGHERRKDEAKSQRRFLFRKRHGQSKQKNSGRSRQSDGTMEDANIDPKAMSDDAIVQQIGTLEHIVSAGLRLVSLYEERERRNLP